MKTLLIMRHAEAVQRSGSNDWERPLTEFGKMEAAQIAQRLHALSLCPDYIVASGAIRAHETARVVAESLGSQRSISDEDQIYDADLDTLLSVVRKLPDSAVCVLLVGHNPGCEQLAAALGDENTQQVDLPTAGLAHLEFKTERWSRVREGTGRCVAVY